MLIGPAVRMCASVVEKATKSQDLVVKICFPLSKLILNTPNANRIDVTLLRSRSRASWGRQALLFKKCCWLKVQIIELLLTCVF